MFSYSSEVIMINSLSILIPTYNKVCIELVKALQVQASTLSNFEYEILVADDGSTDLQTIKGNREINKIANCQYLERERNEGRAKIRNFLAKEAKYDWLLFIDSNMNVISNDYIAKYHNSAACDVVYGGYRIKTDEETKRRLSNNLRYIFETAAPQNGNYLLRKAKPYADFHTSNFMVRRTIMMKYPLDERFRHYGYEDVLWGKTLKNNNIKIYHIDNALGYDNFIGNMAFISKTEESLRTLFEFKTELKDYSKLIRWANTISRYHLKPLCHFLFPLLSLPIKAKLTGNKPCILWFNIYKLLYYIHLYR